MMDVEGPEIRTRRVEEAIDLKTTDRFELYIESAVPSGDLPAVSVNYPDPPSDMEVRIMWSARRALRLSVLATT